MGKKKFIDKKKAATFALVFKESVEGGDLGSERVFTQISGPCCLPGFEESNKDEKCLNYEDRQEEGKVEDSIFDDTEENGDKRDNKQDHELRSSGMEMQRGLPQSLRQELLELGFADDGYNYMQHLRTVGRSGGSSLFVPATRRHSESLRPDVKVYDASNVKIEAVPDGSENSSNNLPIKVSSSTRQIQYSHSRVEVFDEEILAALEDSNGSDCTSTEALDDDFVIMANQGSGDSIPSSSNTSSHITQEILTAAQCCIKNIQTVAEEVTGGSQVRPSRLLDEQFEMLAIREYEEDDFFEPEEPDPLSKGHAEISQFSSVFSDFLNSTAISSKKYDTPDRTGEFSNTNVMVCGSQDIKGHRVSNETNSNMDCKLNEWYHVHYESVQELGSEEEELVVVESQSEDEEQWDCQSVISTFSNLENHPGKITIPSYRPPGKHPTLGMALKSVESTNQYIQLGGRQKLPVEFLDAKGSLSKAEQNCKGKDLSLEMKHQNAGDTNARRAGPRGGETPEERKARKGILKEERREARKMKKDLKLKYKGISQKAQLGAAVMGPPTMHLA